MERPSGVAYSTGLRARATEDVYHHHDPSLSSRVRRYELVQRHMDILEHFQDNLNQNFSNGQAVDNFIRVAHEAEDALNAKYGDAGGGFHDPANFDPNVPVDVTWYNVYKDDSHAMPTGIARGDGQI